MPSATATVAARSAGRAPPTARPIPARASAVQRRTTNGRRRASPTSPPASAAPIAMPRPRRRRSSRRDRDQHAEPARSAQRSRRDRRREDDLEPALGLVRRPAADERRRRPGRRAGRRTRRTRAGGSRRLERMSSSGKIAVDDLADLRDRAELLGRTGRPRSRWRARTAPMPEAPGDRRRQPVAERPAERVATRTGRDARQAPSASRRPAERGRAGRTPRCPTRGGRRRSPARSADRRPVVTAGERPVVGGEREVGRAARHVLERRARLDAKPMRRRSRRTGRARRRRARWLRPRTARRRTRRAPGTSDRDEQPGRVGEDGVEADRVARQLPERGDGGDRSRGRR